jgi:probable HAF family extracellular repeat protein
MVGLGDLPGSFFDSVATGVSADGMVIVGNSTSDRAQGTPYGTEAFLWDPEHGMRSVQTLLEQHGLDLAGWLLFDVTDVSADGRTLVGRGTNRDGNMEAWIAIVPEPGVASLLAWGLLLLALKRR